MVIVGTGLRSDSVKRFLNKLSYNEIFKMNSSVWRDVRSQNGSQSGIVGLREGNRVWRVSPDRWMATYDVKDLPGTTIPSTPITSEDFVLSACTQASAGFKMITSMPFKFDSGASAPISPIQEDFINYRSVAPHDVKGLGGIVVQAVGIGNIVIHQAPNRALVLYNALHIPNAGVQLISVSALWRYS